MLYPSWPPGSVAAWHSDDARGSEDDVLALPHGVSGHHAGHRGLQLLDSRHRELGPGQEAAGDAAAAQERDQSYQ